MHRQVGRLFPFQDSIRRLPKQLDQARLYELFGSGLLPDARTLPIRSVGRPDLTSQPAQHDQAMVAVAPWPRPMARGLSYAIP
jgi:hypothetical protein